MIDFESWRAGVLRRLAEPRVAAGTWAPEEADTAAAELFAALLPDGLATDGHDILTLDGRGHVWLRVTGSEAFVFDWDLDLDSAAVTAIEQAAAVRGATLLRINVFDGAEARRLVDGHGFSVGNYQMRKRPSATESAVDLRPMTEAEFAAFRRTEEHSYAEDLVRARQASSFDEALARATAEDDESFPEHSDEFLRTAFSGADAVGTLWMDFEGSQAFVLDLYVEPDARRRGHGRAIMAAAEAEASSRGALVLGLSVFGHNDAAIALYRRIGFAATEQMLWKELG
ncbi:MAG TPA: N-acetyltransferase [Micromonosporaceae bacterium]